MKYYIFIAFFCLISINLFGSGELTLFNESNDEENAGPTHITSDGRMEVDYANNVADLYENVLVNDPKMDMRSDRMKVFFNPKSKEIEKVIATGRVRFKKDEKQAKSHKAVYTKSDGTIILTGDPMVKKGVDILSGEKITFFRNDDRMICEPSAKLIFYDANDKNEVIDEDWFWALEEDARNESSLQNNDQLIDDGGAEDFISQAPLDEREEYLDEVAMNPFMLSEEDNSLSDQKKESD